MEVEGKGQTRIVLRSTAFKSYPHLQQFKADNEGQKRTVLFKTL